MEAHLVGDTNLYFECKALEELPWRDLGFDPVVILLTKPVLDEIDNHKKANGRTRKRAIEIFQRVRGMLNTSATEIVIQENSPRVVLRRISNVPPDSSLEKTLDYKRNDDRLIGIVATLNKEASAQTMLFTDDTGPAATADSLSLPFLMIPESWRRPAQVSNEEKRIRELEKDLATYRSQEPKISIGPCVTADEEGIVTVTRTVAQPLTDAEIDEILAALRLKHPMKQDFSSAVPPPDQSQVNSGIVIRFEPPSDEEIKNYQDVLYPQWLGSCRKMLAELHQGRDEFEGPILIQWEMSNDGTRPASQVRVQFVAQGPLEITRRYQGDNEEESGESQSSAANPDPRFPSPPRSPTFKKVVTHVPVVANSPAIPSADIASLGSARLLRDFEGLNAAAKAALAMGSTNHMLTASKMVEQAGGMSRLLDQHRRIFETPGMEAILRSAVGGVSRPQIDFPIHKPLIPPTHDTEAFYYDDWPTMRPVKKGALTCDLWRHQDRKQVFEFEVGFTEDGEARGSILCTVHAENLTKPESSRISIIRKVELFRPLGLARSMIEKCA